MTTRTHDAVCLVAVILNIPAGIWGLQYWCSLARTPLHVWNYQALILVWLSLAPLFVIVAIMEKAFLIVNVHTDSTARVSNLSE
jgi:hypothetical protein